MLEIIRLLSKSSQPLRHSIIFLFNGAEETPLQASHGFITGHRWARDVKAFINLESCGAGGREVLFQAGPGHPWLLDHYVKSAPHPHGLVVAEEIFQSGLVPSDTDFRIFRDFGSIPGLDFAHTSNGYVYHTKYDNMKFIPMGSLQHTGDNMLALIKEIVSSDELDNTEKSSQGRMVYFDFLGLIMISYSEEMGWNINIIVIILSFYTQLNFLTTIGRGYPCRQISALFIRSVLYTLYGWMSGVGIMVVTAYLLDIFQKSMRWYSTPIMIFPLYFVPMICANMTFYLSRGRGLMAALEPVEKAQVYIDGVKFLFCVILLLGTLLEIRSSFILMLLVASHTLMCFVLIIGKKQQSFYPWIIAHLLGATFGLIFLMYLTIMSYTLFIPIMGRMGSERNPEFFIGALSSMLCILSTSFYTPLIVLLKHPRTILLQLGSLFLLILVVIACTRPSFPYSGDPAAPSPHRIIIHHTHQIFHELGGRAYYEDSGFWIIHLDRYNPDSLKDIVPDMAKAKSIEPLCEKTVYCGLPLLSPRLLPMCNSTYWIAAEEPILHFGTSVELLKRKWLDKHLLEMTFAVNGPDRLEVFISPNIDVMVANWSFTSHLPSGKPLWKNRSTYFIHYTSGNLRSKMTFTLKLQVPYHQANILDIGVVGHYINSHHQSKPFKDFLKKYPSWIHVTPMTSMYASWKF